MDLLGRIDELLKLKKISLPQLAKETGITASTLYSWYHRNSKNISIGSIEKLCAALGITLAQFFDETYTPTGKEK